MSEELIEVETEESLAREAAAQRLRDLADQLSRQNAVTFTKGGLRHTLKVPGQVTYSVEIEVTDEGGEIEVEITW
ncbi:MAG TPA: amphi-Trp domain-containing protein [Acidimicrobiales bacterium]|nr:amphi-Trp domain-containing protein [Acidimicrobiales bacterium]